MVPYNLRVDGINITLAEAGALMQSEEHLHVELYSDVAENDQPMMSPP